MNSSINHNLARKCQKYKKLNLQIHSKFTLFFSSNFFLSILNNHIFGLIIQIIEASWKHFLKLQVSTVILMYFGGLWDVTQPQDGPSKKFHFSSKCSKCPAIFCWKIKNSFFAASYFNLNRPVAVWRPTNLQNTSKWP